MNKISYFTSEHVSPGHPDKVCDAIAEAIVDFHLNNSTVKPRVAVDGLVKNNKIWLAGEITSTAECDYNAIVKEVLTEIGYTPEKSPEFNYDNFILHCEFTKQSPDIAQGVDNAESTGAGDIGIMFGGAVNEAPDFTCWSHYLARLLSFEIYKYNFPWAKPDQKTQVTIKYVDGVPVAISDIIVCISHEESKPLEEIRTDIENFVSHTLTKYKVFKKLNIQEYRLYVNPTGKFVQMGPIADSGEVGRKIVCDQYGGYFPVGGGNLNGKDATKVDRSAVYMARYVAKKVVANKLADLCQIEVSYGIGMIDPISIDVECFGTNKVSMEEIYEFVDRFSFRPKDIIAQFKLDLAEDLRLFKYRNLGKFGHIGQRFDKTNLPWE